MSAPKASVAVVLTAALALPAPVLAAPSSSSLLANVGTSQPATAGDPAAMSDEEKLEVAKGLYGEGDTAFQAGSFQEALTKFEEAYNVYAPSFHVFNFNIGAAAYELGDCVKAKTAFQRFLDLVPEHPSRADAQEKLLEIDRSGCANTVAPTPTPTPVTTPVTTAPVLEDEEDSPILTSKHDEREEAAEREREERDAKKKDPLLVAGAVLTGLGGAALIGSAISLALANAKANRLAELASPGATGFPDGNYGDDEVFNLDQTRLPANNTATIVLFAGGLVVTGVGIGLLVKGVKNSKKGGKKKKKKKDKDARAGGPTLTNVGPAFLPGGGGAAATVRF